MPKERYAHYVEELVEEQKELQQSQHKEEKGCYIATCVYGSYDCSQVWILRRFKDYVLDKT